MSEDILTIKLNTCVALHCHTVMCDIDLQMFLQNYCWNCFYCDNNTNCDDDDNLINNNNSKG